MSELHAVTGAFGFSGKYIARRLLQEGKEVITLTGSPDRPNSFQGRVPAYPYTFSDPDAMAAFLEGVTVLYNTYWVRFNHKLFSYKDAVENTLALFQAAKEAGVERIVHISIASVDKGYPLEYFSCKKELESALQETGISYAILRPAVLFGKEDILINNIAWILRRLPFFFVFGDGNYSVSPIYVDDLAALAVHYGSSKENIILSAIGPESFTYRELVTCIGDAIGFKRPILTISPQVGYIISRIIGALMGDVFISKEEIVGLMENLLNVEEDPTGTTRLSLWVQEHTASVGVKYANEIARRLNRKASY